MRRPPKSWLVLTLLLVPAWADAADSPADAVRALRRAAEFFRNDVASGGGYVWRYSSDLKYRIGEGVAGPSTIWIQPPGTPAVGEAFLDAHAATKDSFYLDAAREVGQALVKGQLESGGWYYRVELDPARRGEFRYRVEPTSAKRTKKQRPDPLDSVGGWELWKKQANKDNITIVDDDTTPAALRFLIRLDKATDLKDPSVHEAALYALDSLQKAQHPVGGWSHNYDRFPPRTPDPGHYPVLDATFPETWSRTWTNDWTACYSINDRITLNVIKTMLAAWEAYRDARYRAAAEQGGSFLIHAQLPDPQPAWAQQYDRRMHPVWERKFEPPAITGFESQDALETLLLLHRKTGDPKYLAPIPRALAYLKKSRLPDGQLARFYELKTNRPLYFTHDYRLTYENDDVPTHYGFAFPSRLDSIEAAYRRQRDGDRTREETPTPLTPEFRAKVHNILTTQDNRGAWTEPGTVRDLENRKVIPKDGTISSASFINNVQVLCTFLNASHAARTSQSQPGDP